MDILKNHVKKKHSKESTTSRYQHSAKAWGVSCHCLLSISSLFYLILEDMNGSSVCVKLLEWFECVESNSLPDSFHHFDIIVAADVVCSLSLFVLVFLLVSTSVCE